MKVRFIEEDDTVGFKEPPMLEINGRLFNLTTYGGMTAEKEMRQIAEHFKPSIGGAVKLAAIPRDSIQLTPKK